MRVFPASQFRAPLLSRVALVSTVPAGAAVLAFVAAVEARGVTRYALVAVALIVTIVGVRWAWRVAQVETEQLYAIPSRSLGLSLRLRWVVPALCAAVVLVTLMMGRNEQRQKEYDNISVEYEGQGLAPHFVGNMISTDEVLPDGLHKSVDWDRIAIGPFVDGKASGEWKLTDFDGHSRGRVTMKGGELSGPCEFWDVSGKRRVRGAYKGWYRRVGLWTLDNVFGEGRTYALYRPSSFLE